MNNDDLANWRCRCGRLPSMDHQVNGYCSGRIEIEKLESLLTQTQEEIAKMIRDQEASFAFQESQRLKLQRIEAERDCYHEALENYGQHDPSCVRSMISAGRPTADGNGYENLIRGKWYQIRPIDETPKCECGFDEALQGGEK